jgi:hypothetical protein
MLCVVMEFDIAPYACTLLQKTFMHRLVGAWAKTLLVNGAELCCSRRRLEIADDEMWRKPKR